MPKPQRRLAALMFTDMVGYSALTQKDEALSMVLLRQHRSLMRPLFDAHGGNEVKTTGDGFLVEFASALGAVQCAISMQQTLVEHNESAPQDRRIQIRIGVNFGEIEEYENDIYGDGVNVAARIEPLAEPNGICISAAVAHQVDRKIDYPLVSMGEPVLKNIQDPIEVFRVVLPWLVDAVHFVPQKFKDDATAAKSIAVLPFVNMSSDEENEYFSDGLTEELINVLTRLEHLKVTSRTSVFVFKGKRVPLQQIGKQLGVGTVLEGSVRKAGNRVRVTGQLIRVADDAHLWSGTFDRDLEDIFAVQDEIAQAIVEALKVHLAGEVVVVRVKRPTDNMDAYTLYLQGRFHFNKLTPEGIRQSIDYYERAIAQDPKYALAFVGLGLAHLRLVELSPNPDYTKAREAADRAVVLDDGLAEAHALKATVIRNQDWDFAEAEKSYKIALALHPVDVMVYNGYGALLLFMRKCDAALAMHTLANEMDPLHLPTLIWLARANTYCSRYDKAIEICEKVIGMAPEFPLAHMGLAIAYLWRGAYQKALDLVEVTRHLSEEHAAISVVAAIAQHRMGNSEQLQQILTRLLDEPTHRMSEPVYIALLYAELGEEDQAMAWFQKAYEDRAAYLLDVKAYPRNQPVYQLPKIAQFLDSIGNLPGSKPS